MGSYSSALIPGKPRNHCTSSEMLCLNAACYSRLWKCARERRRCHDPLHFFFFFLAKMTSELWCSVTCDLHFSRRHRGVCFSRVRRGEAERAGSSSCRWEVTVRASDSGKYTFLMVKPFHFYIILFVHSAALCLKRVRGVVCSCPSVLGINLTFLSCLIHTQTRAAAEDIYFGSLLKTRLKGTVVNSPPPPFFLSMLCWKSSSGTIKAGAIFQRLMYFTYQMSQTRLALQVTLMMEEEQRKSRSDAVRGGDEERAQNGSLPPVSMKGKQSYRFHNPGLLCCSDYFFHCFVFQRQQKPKLVPRRRSPLSCRRPCPLRCTRLRPQASPPTHGGAETRRSALHQTCNNCTRSWETWGASLSRWRVSTSTAALPWLHISFEFRGICRVFCLPARPHPWRGVGGGFGIPTPASASASASAVAARVFFFFSALI